MFKAKGYGTYLFVFFSAYSHHVRRGGQRIHVGFAVAMDQPLDLHQRAARAASLQQEWANARPACAQQACAQCRFQRRGKQH